MKSRKFLYALNISSDALNRLSTILDRIETGTSEVLTTPIANETSPDDILQGWDDIFNANRSKMNSDLLTLEESNRSKYGPRSIAIPWSERRETTLSTFGDSDLGTELTAVVPTRNRLRPLNLESALAYLKNSTSSGLPFMVKKVHVKGAILADYKELLARKDPCVLFTRTQELKKTRDVAGFPIADTLNEMRFFQPLLAVQRRLPWRSAVNTPDVVNASMTRIYKEAISKSKPLVSIDFKGYDRTVKRGLQTAAFRYIKQCFQSQYTDDLDYIADRFNTIGFVTPEGILSGPHGVPSGSTFTNEVDSIVQYLVASNCDSVDLNHLDIQGDDGVYISSNPDELFACYTDVGLEVGYEKTKVSEDVIHYLQMLYHRDYARGGNLVGVYPTYRALSRLVYPERFEDFSKDDISGKDFFAIRALSILENCKWHPLFKEFVSYCLSVDKYKLQFSDLGLRNYVKRLRYQEGKDISFTKYQYGDDISGIRGFSSYLLVKELV